MEKQNSQVFSISSELKKNKGFTILEIVVAVIVLGILIGAAAGQIQKFMALSQDVVANEKAALVQHRINMEYSNASLTIGSTCAANYTTALGRLTPAVNAPINLEGGWWLTGLIPATGAITMTGADGRTYTNNVRTAGQFCGAL